METQVINAYNRLIKSKSSGGRKRSPNVVAPTAHSFKNGYSHMYYTLVITSSAAALYMLILSILLLGRYLSWFEVKIDSKFSSY